MTRGFSVLLPCRDEVSPSVNYMFNRKRREWAWGISVPCRRECILTGKHWEAIERVHKG
jgi:hypothetical protein